MESIPNTVWIDADACPRVVKDIVYRAVHKRKIQAILVANSYQQHPRSERIRMIVVAKEPDEADNTILEQCKTSDLVITADIILADKLVKKGVVAINPRGEVYTDANVGNRLATRNLMSDLRDEGVVRGGPSNYNDRDKQKFASSLDKYLTLLKNKLG